MKKLNAKAFTDLVRMADTLGLPRMIETNGDAGTGVQAARQIPGPHGTSLLRADQRRYATHPPKVLKSALKSTLNNQPALIVHTLKVCDANWLRPARR